MADTANPAKPGKVSELAPLQMRVGRPTAELRAMFRSLLDEYAAPVIAETLTNPAVHRDTKLRAIDLAGKYGLGPKPVTQRVQQSGVVRHVVVALPALDVSAPIGGAGDALIAAHPAPVLIAGPALPAEPASEGQGCAGSEV